VRHRFDRLAKQVLSVADAYKRQRSAGTEGSMVDLIPKIVSAGVVFAFCSIFLS
jgi:hypothetical protein